MNPTRDFQLKCSNFFNCSIDYLNGLTDVKAIVASKNYQKLYNDYVYEVQQLDKKNYIDIELYLNVIIDTLESEDGFTLNGNIIDDEDIQIVSDAIKVALKNVKLHSNK